MHVPNVSHPVVPTGEVRDYGRILLGLTVVLVGIAMLLDRTELVDSSVWTYVWPSVVIVAGLLVIASWRGVGAIRHGPSSDDLIRAVGIFGGPSVASASQAFRGAAVTAVFGGVTLDLRSARPVPDGAVISATAAFGGIDVIVPHGWRVAIRAIPIFGGISDKTVHEPDLPADAPLVRIDAIVAFGGIDIKHAKE